MLWAALCLFTAGQMWAQTDVTSQYLTNPSFESDGSQGSTKVPTGWTLGKSEGGYTSYRPISDTKTPNGAYAVGDGAGISGATDGSCYLYMRTNWGSGVIDINQTTKTLPAGIYELQADVLIPFSTNQLPSLTLSIGDAQLLVRNDAPIWQTVCISKELSSAGTLSVSFKHETGEGCSPGCLTLVDNVRLVQYNHTSLQTLISKAEAQYNASNVGADVFLAAINTAKAIATTSALGEVKAGIQSLQAAIDTYKVANYAAPTNADYTSWITNANLESTTGGTVYMESSGSTWNNTIPSGWKVARAAGGRNTVKISGYTGQGYETWGNTVNGGMMLFQVVNSLPAGKYTLSGYLAQSGKIFVQKADGERIYSNAKTSGSWEKFSVSFIKESAEESVIFGGVGIPRTNDVFGQYDDFTLTCDGLDVSALIATYNDYYSKLKALDLNKVRDTYKASVSNAIETYENRPSLVADIEAANNAMSTLIADYDNQVELYRQDENVATYNRIDTDYEFPYESLLSTDLTKWATSDFVVMTADQHWDGSSSQRYYEQSGAEWSQNSWVHHAEETVTLPEGKYIMTITARSSAQVTSSMSVKVGDAEAQVVALPNKGDNGYGVATDGTATFSSDATYANNGAGRGWEYRFIEFTVAAGGQPVTVAFDASANTVHQWVSIANPMLYGNVHPNQVVILQINNLAANLRSYESKPMDKALYAGFAEDLAAADAATVDSENLDKIVAALQADIAKAQASVDAYAAYKSTYDFYVEKVGQMDEAGQTSWNENAGAAYAGYTNGTMTDVVAEEAKLKGIFNAAVLAQGEDADLTLLITNPNYDNGNEGWADTHNSTGGWTISYDGKFSYSAPQQLRHGTVYQENIVLPAGTYCVSAEVYALDPRDATSIYIYATTGGVNHWVDLWSETASTAFDGYVKVAYYDIDNKGTDQVLSAYFTLEKEDSVRIGALTWGANWNGNGKGAFSVDTWTLRRLSSFVEGTTHKKFYGNFTKATVQAEVSAEVQVLDLTTASGLSNITLNVANPNMLIYATAGQVASSQSNVIVDGTCAALSVADGYPFYVPTAFTATSATYTMNAVATEGSTSMGTLVLPFAVSTMPGKAYELIEEVAMGDVIYATPVTTIAANKPVLVSAKGAYTGSGEVAATHGGTYTNGYLVGTYNEFAAPQGSYVLQKHDNNVAFYLVGDVQPTVKPFRAYIKGAEASNLVKSIAIDFGFDATGIEGVESAQGVVEVARYNAAGVQIAAPQKGVNFVRMSDGSVLKVMVK